MPGEAQALAALRGRHHSEVGWRQGRREARRLHGQHHGDLGKLIMSLVFENSVVHSNSIGDPVVDKSMVKVLYVTRMTTSPPPKRARSDAPSASQLGSDSPTISWKVGSDGVPTSSQQVTPLSPRVSPRTTLEIKTAV